MRLYQGPVIDAHCHFWEPETGNYPWLRKDVLVPHRYGDYSAIKSKYLPEDYQVDALGQNIVAAIYCEAEWRPEDPLGEVAYVHQLARDTGFPNAMAAQAWLNDPSLPELLQNYSQWPLTRSVRHKPGASKGPNSWHKTLLSDPLWQRGYDLLARYGFHFELQTPWWHLEEAAIIARDFPATSMIVNHAGVPGARDQDTLAGWRKGLEAIAVYPNTFIKLSGLCLPGCVWTDDNSRSVVHDIIKIFGADRIMVGSNFPVDKLFASMPQIFDTFRRLTAHLSLTEQEAIFMGTAKKIYRPFL